MSLIQSNPHEEAAREEAARMDEQGRRAARRQPAVETAVETAAEGVQAATPEAAATEGAAAAENTGADGPSANGPSASGRDETGRFIRGNKGGPGNPFARQVARVRQRLLDKLTDEEVDAIVDALIARAKSGEVAAAKLLLSYGIGKPTPAVDPDQLDMAEWAHWKATAPMMNDLPGMLRCLMPQVLLEMVRYGRPEVSAKLGQQLSQALLHPETVMPEVPELVMARSDKPLKGGGKAAGDARPANPPDSDPRGSDPRGSEYLASGLGNGGGLSESRRRAWGLDAPRFGGVPSTNRKRGTKKSRKAGKRPSTKGGDGRPGDDRHAPSSNGMPAGLGYEPDA